VKEFVIYTALRILLFAASLALVIGGWLAFDRTVPLALAFLVALLLSGVGSYFLLNHYRERFAQVVQRRAERATAAFEELNAKEDAD
jgi:hypothetical protein